MKTAYPAVSRPGSYTFRFPVNVHLPLLFRPASFRLPVVRMGGILFLVMAAAGLSVSAQDIAPGPGGEGGPCQSLALPGPPCSRAEAYRLQREAIFHSPVSTDIAAQVLRARQIHCLDLLLAEAERECASNLGVTPPSPTTPASGGTSGYPGPKPPETPADCHLPPLPDIADPCSRVRFIHDIWQRMQQHPGTPAHCLDIVKRLYLEESQACEHTRSSDTGRVTASQGNGNYPPGDKPQHPDLSHAPVHPGPYRTFKPGIPDMPSAGNDFFHDDTDPPHSGRFRRGGGRNGYGRASGTPFSAQPNPNWTFEPGIPDMPSAGNELFHDDTDLPHSGRFRRGGGRNGYGRASGTPFSAQPNPMSPPCAHLYQMLQAARERQAGRPRERSMDQIEQRFRRLCGDIPAPAIGTVMMPAPIVLHGPHIPPPPVMMPPPIEPHGPHIPPRPPATPEQ